MNTNCRSVSSRLERTCQVESDTSVNEGWLSSGNACENILGTLLVFLKVHPKNTAEELPEVLV